MRCGVAKQGSSGPLRTAASERITAIARSANSDIFPLGHTSRQKAADDRLAIQIEGPDDGPFCPVWFGDDGIFGDVNPLPANPNPIVVVLAIPIDI